MTATLAPKRKSTHGSMARRLRVYCHLSLRELADLANVPRQHVDLFEHDLPLPLDSRRRILRELWAIKVKK